MSDPSVVLPTDGSRPGTPWWIRSTRFVTVDAPQTYDVGAVAQLREALAVAVESWRPVTPVIAAANLTPTSGGEGYDARAVDQWLAMVKAAMNEGVPAAVLHEPVVPAPVPAAATRAEPAEPAVPLDPDDDRPVPELVRRIHDARFTPLRFRHGYVIGEVDDFLDELVAAVTAGERIADRVREVGFTESRMRECYEIEDVETFLVGLVRDHDGVEITRTTPSA